MWKEVHIYSVKAKSQAGKICVKDIITTQKAEVERKSVRDLKKLCILPENLAEDLCSGTEHCPGYIYFYENISRKLLHLPHKCYPTQLQGSAHPCKL